MMRYNVRILKVDSLEEARKYLHDIAPSREGFGIMLPKLRHYLVRVDGLDTRAANILKQDMLSLGGEVSLPRNVFEFQGQTTPAIISGTGKQFQLLLTKLKNQPFGLRKLQEELAMLFQQLEVEKRRELRIGGRAFDLSRRTLVMGVVNVTPDSFSDGGKFLDRRLAVERGLELEEEGADILDIGGESTRPGSDFIPLEEELSRVIPVIEELASRVSIPVSVDTTKAEVAREALESGAGMVNDISAGRLDPRMLSLVAERGVPVCLMHMQGMPKDMQDNPTYQDLMGEIIAFLRERAEAAMGEGVDPSSIIVDPGIGFGKTVEHNLEIIRRLKEIKSIGFPILLGTSRKSFIGKVLDLPVEERLEGTAASVAVGVMNGADIVRVHDVREMVRVVRLTDALLGKGWEGGEGD
jgi:dihydropteroate synthase